MATNNDQPICPMGGTCDHPHVCANRCKHGVGPLLIDTLANNSALHFVGFTDDRLNNAVKVFGKPDFFHRVWDHRAVGDIAPGDVVVFAQYDSNPPTDFSWNDSERF